MTTTIYGNGFISSNNLTINSDINVDNLTNANIDVSNNILTNSLQFSNTQTAFKILSGTKAAATTGTITFPSNYFTNVVNNPSIIINAKVNSSIISNVTGATSGGFTYSNRGNGGGLQSQPIDWIAIGN